MNIPLLLTGSLPGLLMILFGYLIRYRKMYFLISGYNTMSSEKKRKVDTEGLGILMGNCLFVMGGLLVAGMTLMLLGQTAMGLVVLLMLLPVITYLLITAQKYDGNTRNETGHMKVSAKIMLAIIIAGLVLLVGWGGYALFDNSRALVVDVSNQTIQIKGAYGVTIDRSQVASITLHDTIPKLLLRTNGSAVGSHLKGNFNMETYGAVRLFIDAGVPPFIIIKSSEKPVILNLGTADETRALYEQLFKK